MSAFGGKADMTVFMSTPWDEKDRVAISRRWHPMTMKRAIRRGERVLSECQQTGCFGPLLVREKLQTTLIELRNPIAFQADGRRFEKWFATFGKFPSNSIHNSGQILPLIHR